MEFLNQNEPIMKSHLIYKKVKEKLMNTELEFGERISITDLIKEYNVSRRPVMDAMKMLENEGFIEIIPQSGCKVIGYHKKTVLDHFLLCSALEQLCAELAATNYNSDEMEELELYQESIRNQKQFDKLHEKTFYLNYNRKFHFYILNMTHSKRISNVTMQVMDLNDFFLLNLFEHFKFDAMDQYHYHSRIIEAIKRRDSIESKKLMEEHTSYINYLKEKLP